MMERMEPSSSSSSSCVPPGFRFHPTDEELVGYYLRKKVASQKIDLQVITDIDLYKIEPWDLQEKCRIGYEEEKEWYFFSHKDKKYPSGTRTNRATMAGFWKATGRDKGVYEYKTSKLIGMRKTLVFYKGRAPNGHKSDWIMHEYRLQSHHNETPQEEGWVVCRAFKKKSIVNSGQTKKVIERWDSNRSFYNDERLVGGGGGIATVVVDPILDHPISRDEPEKMSAYLTDEKFICYADEFGELLPELESPLSMSEKRSSESKMCGRNGKDEDGNNNEKVISADWRAVEKFVASQLMSKEEKEEKEEGELLLLLGESSRFGGIIIPEESDHHSEMAAALLMFGSSNDNISNNGDEISRKMMFSNDRIMHI